MKNNISRLEIIFVVVLMLAYSAISFVNLGDKVVPSIQPDMGDDGKIEHITYVSVPHGTRVSSFMLYKGLGSCVVSIYRVNDAGNSWEEVSKNVYNDIYKWESTELDFSSDKICVSLGGSYDAEIFEAAFLDEDGNKILLDTDGSGLFDEQHLVPKYPSYKNGTYFDEVYHARTAYEHIKGIYPYEISHPPLGKLIIGIGIRLFGMTPFGWRFSGNVFGIAMIWLIYIFSKRLFKSFQWALVSAIILALDFMHFSQTRIATIDSFAVFFIILMYYFMYIYYDSTVQTLSYKKSLKVLALCGISFGLGISTKWICVYAGVGLAVLFAVALFKRYREGENPFKVCLWCVLFFVVIPLIIYFISYIPYYLTDGSASAFKTFFDNQVYMLEYHGTLESTHPFESKWYTWPLVIRPIWYFGSKELAYSELCSTIVAMGNPLIWWVGSFSVIFILFKPGKTKEMLYILTGFASQFVPWIFISRSTFIYHFFASVPFIIVSLAYCLKMLAERFTKGKFIAVILVLAMLVLFFMFYPLISGFVTEREYVLTFLRWFKTWDICF